VPGSRDQRADMFRHVLAQRAARPRVEREC
jgi:hypothetical protein